MGAIGVHTGRGRMTETQVTNLKTATGALRDQFKQANTLVIFPYNFTSMQSVLESLNRYGSKLEVAQAARGYAIAMSGATQSEKDNFVSLLSTRIAREETTIESRVSEALRAVPNLNRAQQRVVAEMLRSTYQRELIDRLVSADNRRGSPMFGGNIRTRDIRQSDFDKV